MRSFIADLKARLAMQNDPSVMVQCGQSVTLPLEKDAANDLYLLMNARFRAWTGSELRDWKVS